MLRLAFGNLIKLLVRSITIYLQNDISIFVVSISHITIIEESFEPDPSCCVLVEQAFEVS